MNKIPAKTDCKDNLLSIVIITRNSESLLKKCLRSIHENIKCRFEIIVIDNASSDASMLMVQNEFPDVHMIRNTRNRGVAPARNQGLKITRGQYILILDDDTVIKGDAIDKMLAFMKSHRSVGLCAPRLVSADGKLLFTCKRFPSLGAFIMNRLIKKPSSGSPAVLRNHLMVNWDHDAPAVVDYVIGACQLINKEALDQIGHYDDKIFYGPEDIDYCFRMWRNGWQVWYLPHSTVVHETQRLTKKKPLSMLGIRHFLAIMRMFTKYRYRDFSCITTTNEQARNSPGTR